MYSYKKIIKKVNESINFFRSIFFFFSVHFDYNNNSIAIKLYIKDYISNFQNFLKFR